jgi:RNA polymerase sigma-70 factor (ECF subfamily)
LTEKEFSGLFNTWFDPVRRYICYRCGDADLATDIAQETFVRLWEKNISPMSVKVPGLMYKIAGDLMISHFRREKVKMNYQVNLRLDEMASSPEESLLFQELLDQYNKLLAGMPEKQRTVFLLSRVDELKYHEIASRMGISVKAVEKRMTLALKTIRKELGDYGTR